LGILGFEYARIMAMSDDPSLLEPAREAATEALELSRQLKGQLPWGALAHATLALVAEAEGDSVTAADEARNALDFDGETFLVYFVPILWVAARVLIAGDEPEAASLSAQIIAGLSYLGMSLGDSELREKWFASPLVAAVSSIVGFDPAESLAADEAEGPALTEDDLDLLRELASGSGDRRPEVESLLSKLGVKSENEAIQYAIKAGVTWR
jgi:hypothetical protein